jgi:hypothetical protein
MRGGYRDRAEALEAAGLPDILIAAVDQFLELGLKVLPHLVYLFDHAPEPIEAAIDAWVEDVSRQIEDRVRMGRDALLVASLRYGGVRQLAPAQFFSCCRRVASWDLTDAYAGALWRL